MVFPGALGNQIDETGDPVAIAHGHLAQNDPVAAKLLQRCDDVRDTLGCDIDLVDEKKGRDFSLVEAPQIGRRQNRGILLGRHAENGRVARGQNRPDLRHRIMPARRLERGPWIAHELELRHRRIAIHALGLGSAPVDLRHALYQRGLA